MKPALKQKLKRILAAGLKIGAAVFVFLAGLLLLLNALFPFPQDAIKEARFGASPFLLDKNGGLIALRVDTKDNWRLPVDIHQVSPWLIKATIATEDKRFNSHPGVDPLAASRALCQNVFHLKRVSGASTLTMQCMRLLWHKDRSYTNKLVESFRALQVERLLDKNEILELYFNLAPYGGNVIGAEAAARRYFGKSAANLTLGEAALLAGLPQSPGQFNPARNLYAAVERRKFVLRQMQTQGFITSAQQNAAESETVFLCPPVIATSAPHFADYVIARRQKSGGVVSTTLDPEIQNAANECAHAYAALLRQMGIDGAAVVVIDVERSEISAMVGHLQPSDPQTGHVNCAMALRQPGSLLKPFIYANAFERGLLTPADLVYDLPAEFKDYQPENMDKAFLGPLKVSSALQLSRNLPAVDTLNQLGIGPFLEKCRLLGFDYSGLEKQCGLSLALGTGETNLIAISNAYATLARLGIYRELQWNRTDHPAPEKRVFTEGASYLALRALGADTPDKPLCPVYKTGTSWNHRDAWCVLISPKYVIGVWCGLISGEGHQALAGARVAKPLAVELMTRLVKPGDSNWQKPEEVAQRRVCSLSGMVTSSNCPGEITGDYLPGVSTERPCPLHFRNVSDGQVVIRWPKKAAAWLNRKNIPAQEEKSLRIVSPSHGASYVLPLNNEMGGITLPFLAQSASSANVYWFLDGEIQTNAAPGKAWHWKMTPGQHFLTAVDEKGTRHTIKFSVLSDNSSPRAQ